MNINDAITYPPFSKDAMRELGHYVYTLADPRNGHIFYVGKGVDDRWSQHVSDARKNLEDESLKLGKIREIEDAGLAVQVDFVRHQLGNHRDAFEAEASVIDTFKLLHRIMPEVFEPLTNKVSGHEVAGKGLMSANEASKMYNAEPAEEITDPVMLFNLARTWTPEMSDEALYTYTHHAWKCYGPARHKAKYAFAVSYNIVRAVYSIDRWRDRAAPDHNWEEDQISKKPRLVFECDHAPHSNKEMGQFVQRSVKPLLDSRNIKQWSFLYLNCD